MSNEERESLARLDDGTDTSPTEGSGGATATDDPTGEVPINADESFLTGPSGVGVLGVNPQYDSAEDPVRRT